ncbi:MAG: hypothetical protein R2705_06630 [Ilumatobacteraceae bacterium]
MTSLTKWTGGSTFVKPIDGKILLNAGLLSGNNADPSEPQRFHGGDVVPLMARPRWLGIDPPPPGSSPTNCDDLTIAASNTPASSPASFALTCTDDAWWAVAGR